ncbi:MAG: hypothetical protein CMP67_01050 [Flavobacteriales bacterium]|nr:hypothetical protein [Flavobacteriales bacterium]|tara:strand:- start:35170 stop:35682 length:513 start_codon:yes stop_codon:yes gene_type:complete
MKYSYRLKDIFECSEERAFKAPILGDATKFMKGYLFQPPVTGFEEDQTWGQINGIRYPISNGNLFVHKGRMFKDVILERDENKYWKWTIYDFEFKTLFFIERAIGEWEIKKLSDNKTEVIYTYTYYSKKKLFKPLTWLLVNIQIKGIMIRALAGIKLQAQSNDDFIYKTN